ncbi:MAG: endonuclease/exonuclease/phosphatase family protein [Rhodocyclaceae bacterium]|nr:endonuclease/exonuclease/phosphatase family protein [Rhodocyclaceae bacterium]
MARENGETPQWRTLVAANFNTLNLALPGHRFYPNQDPWSERDYLKKTRWLGEQIRRLNPDIAAFEEVWDAAALAAAVKSSRLRYPEIHVPGAEHGAVGTPRVGLVTRLAVESVDTLVDFPADMAVEVPELGLALRFERPVLHARLRVPKGPVVDVVVVHLKSKRPKYLMDADGSPREDRDDPRIQARATLRSLIIRGAEAAALRAHVVDLLHRTRDPLILMGDLNDGPMAVTTQIIAATGTIAYDRSARDTALFHAYDVQSGQALRKDVAYTHVHQGTPDLLDQIWVSEEFVAGSRYAIGDVRRVDYFNDHIHEARDGLRSDHGFVRALLRVRQDARGG